MLIALVLSRICVSAVPTAVALVASVVIVAGMAAQARDWMTLMTWVRR